MRIAIVEDEQRIQAQLRQYILRYFEGREKDVNIAVFADGDEILEAYSADYDLILLDIQMGRVDGIRTAEEIRRMDDDVYIVFITNMVNYAIKGYSVRALDFVLKPVNYLMLKQQLAHVEELIARRMRKYITLPTENGLARIDVSQVYYVETNGHTVNIYTAKGLYRMRSSMKNMEEMLSNYGFARCNSCFLVNLAHVERVEDGSAYVAERPLAISRPRYKGFMERLTVYFGGGKS